MMEAILNHQRPVLKVGCPPNLNLNWATYGMQRLSTGFFASAFRFRGLDWKKWSSFQNFLVVAAKTRWKWGKARLLFLAFNLLHPWRKAGLM